VNNLVDLSASIEMLGEAFKKLNTIEISSDGLASIQGLLNQADALKSLATILTSDQAKIEGAIKAVGGTGSAGKKAELQELSEYNKAVTEYYMAQ